MINALTHINLKKAAVIAGCFFVCGCSNDFQQVRDLGKKKPGKDEAYTITAYMSEGGKQKAKLVSPVMIESTGDTAKMTFPKTLHVEFYDDSAKPESWLFAKLAVNYVNIGRVLLQDSVVVYNVKGDTLHTDELWWDRNKQQFYTDKRIQILKRDGTNIRGIGLTSDQAFKDIHIVKPTGPYIMQDSSFAPN